MNLNQVNKTIILKRHAKHTQVTGAAGATKYFPGYFPTTTI